MNVIILGATGATGLDLLEQALAADHVEQVHIFVRRKLHINHPKLICRVVDFNQPETWQQDISGDVVFSCLGTTLKDAGSKDAQFKVDYTYQYEFAAAAKRNGVEHLVLVSSAGASAKSTFFYTRMKGELENAIKLLHFNQLIIFRPPSLIREASNRKSELVSIKMLQFLNKLGLFRSAQPLPTKKLAQAMIKTSKDFPNGTFSIASRAIWRFAEE
ncbi:MAG: NAD(P)H-binding protein [Mangrovibacterium sp.]